MEVMMKKIMLLALLTALIPAYLPAVPREAQEITVSAFERQGDMYYAARNKIKDTDKAIANIDLAAGNYLKAFDTGAPNAALLYKYIKARDFKYRFLTGTKEEKKTEYERLIGKYELFKVQFSGTKEFNYTMAILWGRRGEITEDTFDASNKDIVENIKKYAEALYGIDRKFEHYAACKILGRIHYIAPNVPFMLTWPDRIKSKTYLEEMIKGDPGNSEGRMFLADTVWDTGDRKTAEKLYSQVVSSLPRKNFWFYDTRAIKFCDARMKTLQIK
jgi:hypothetical protein